MSDNLIYPLSLFNFFHCLKRRFWPWSRHSSYLFPSIVNMLESSFRLKRQKMTIPILAILHNSIPVMCLSLFQSLLSHGSDGLKEERKRVIILIHFSSLSSLPHPFPPPTLFSLSPFSVFHFGNISMVTQWHISFLVSRQVHSDSQNLSNESRHLS